MRTLPMIPATKTPAIAASSIATPSGRETDQPKYWNARPYCSDDEDQEQIVMIAPRTSETQTPPDAAASAAGISVALVLDRRLGWGFDGRRLLRLACGALLEGRWRWADHGDSAALGGRLSLRFSDHWCRQGEGLARCAIGVRRHGSAYSGRSPHPMVRQRDRA